MNNEFLGKDYSSEDFDRNSHVCPPSLLCGDSMLLFHCVTAPMETSKDTFRADIEHAVNQRGLIETRYVLPIARMLDLCLLELSFLLQREILASLKIKSMRLNFIEQFLSEGLKT